MVIIIVSFGDSRIGKNKDVNKTTSGWCTKSCSKKQKELEVKFIAMRDLKQVRTRLGNDIVDFVTSHMHYPYLSRLGHKILFVIPYTCSYLHTSAIDKTSLKKWAYASL